MGLAAEGKVVIEVGLNETASKSVNPQVPYGPDEVVPDAVAAARAGAAVVHFHARTDTGEQTWTDDARYRRAIEGIAAEIDVLTYPSYVEGRLDHVWALEDVLEIAPFDVVQHVSRVAWDADAHRFRAVTALGGSQHADRPVALDQLRARGLVPSIACFELGELRWLVHAVDAALLETPVHLKLFLFDQWVKGPFATPAGLDAFVSQLPDGLDHETTVVPYTMNSERSCTALLEHALDLGLHVRVGIGDNPDAFPDRSNADLVAWAVELASARGRTPATAKDVRSRFPEGRQRDLGERAGPGLRGLNGN